MRAEERKVLVIRHDCCSSLGLLEAALYPEKITFEYLQTAQGATLARPLTEYAYIVILGGYMGAYEEDSYPFLRYEFKLIEQALEQRIPTLGICLGSQILARVLGASVYRGKVGREVGWRELTLTEAGRKDPLLGGFPDQTKVFLSHQDTFDLPRDCVHLATSQMYPHQAFRYRDHAWAIQFHLEMNEKILQDAAQVIEQEIVEANVTDISLTDLLESTRHNLPTVQPLAHEFMQQFLSQGVVSAVER